MTAILVALVLVGLIAFNLIMLGSYRFDLKRLDDRMREVEAQAQHLRSDMTTFSQRQLDALWRRAQQEVDQEIVRARERNRS